jgi:hypothetical protein
MGTFSVAQRNTWLDSLASVTVGLFLGSPMGAGVEVSGGDPAYARQTVTLAAASGGERAHSNQPQFNIPAGGHFNYVGYFMGGFCIAEDDIPEETYGSHGIYTLTSGVLSIS